MKKNGFTLVELMSAIAVVGILAAIALPQFGNAIARARAAEVPLNLNKIKSAQEAHKAETKRYLDDNCNWGIDASGALAGNAATQLSGQNLGVDIDYSNYFNYSCEGTATTFSAKAHLYKSIGSADVGTEVKVDQIDQVIVTGGGDAGKSKAAMTLYLRSFVNQ